jgi:hypothetical protein
MLADSYNPAIQLFCLLQLVDINNFALPSFTVLYTQQLDRSTVQMMKYQMRKYNEYIIALSS